MKFEDKKAIGRIYGVNLTLVPKTTISNRIRNEHVRTDGRYTIYENDDGTFEVYDNNDNYVAEYDTFTDVISAIYKDDAYSIFHFYSRL